MSVTFGWALQDRIFLRVSKCRFTIQKYPTGVHDEEDVLVNESPTISRENQKRL